ncbi:SDR family oxidoreductase [Mangrovivirga cuniculi]|uniref:Short-chain dehydrogenase/reductase n=1 Tax=Mangrovivirga cuniculi TaxID=2715131 RepID=A0A4D7K4U2_9BACT|nr:SDR family oxidoreductase [Mangrovivirga cuniculi]QCK14418.1 short-chain dehydrogenase/reductase [Mangrovivirga cuniculi]
MKEHKNKVVLITGSSSGIGKAAVNFFATKEWCVAATMRNPKKEPDYKKGSNVKVFKLDVTDRAEIEQCIKDVMNTFGKIDVVVNNAGYGLIGPLELGTVKQVKKQMDTNVIGLINVTQLIIPYFREQKEGRIINISSIAGKVALPFHSFYNATKFAVEGLSESLSYELKPFNIKVKLIEPGAIKTRFYDESLESIKVGNIKEYDNHMANSLTKIHEFGRNGSGPEEVAKAIFTAAVDQGNRLRYAVGGGAPFLLFLKRITPAPLFRSMIRKFL